MLPLCCCALLLSLVVILPSILLTRSPALDHCDCCPEDSPGLQVPPGYYCHLGDFAPVYLSNQQGILMLPSSFSPTRCRPSQFGVRAFVRFFSFFFFFSLISYLKTSTLPARRALLGLGPAYPCLFTIVHWTDTKRGGGCARSAGGAGRQGCIDQVPVRACGCRCRCECRHAAAGVQVQVRGAGVQVSCHLFCRL